MKFEMTAGSNSPPITRSLASLALLLLALGSTQGALARDADRAGDGLQRYIIEFRDPPLALYDGTPNAGRQQPRVVRGGCGQTRQKWQAGHAGCRQS